jgi:hypothetical protein
MGGAARKGAVGSQPKYRMGKKEKTSQRVALKCSEVFAVSSSGGVLDVGTMADGWNVHRKT